MASKSSQMKKRKFIDVIALAVNVIISWILDSEG